MVDLGEISRLPFVQVALPIMLTFVASTWYQNKRVDDLRTDMKQHFSEIISRLDRIEGKLENLAERVTRLEERSSPLLRR